MTLRYPAPILCRVNAHSMQVVHQWQRIPQRQSKYGEVRGSRRRRCQHRALRGCETQALSMAAREANSVAYRKPTVPKDSPIPKERAQFMRGHCEFRYRLNSPPVSMEIRCIKLISAASIPALFGRRVHCLQPYRPVHLLHLL